MCVCNVCICGICVCVHVIIVCVCLVHEHVCVQEYMPVHICIEARGGGVGCPAVIFYPVPLRQEFRARLASHQVPESRLCL